MTKIVINKCYGGFGLSDAATERLAELQGLKLYSEDGPFGQRSYYTVPPEKYHALKKEIEDRGENYKRLNEKNWYYYPSDIARDDENLLRVIEELGEAASADLANLVVVEIPNGVEWEVEEYDGFEHIAEQHETWG